MLLHFKHLNFQDDKIFMQTPFTLNKLMSAWLSICVLYMYSAWKHNQNDNFTQMYSDLTTKFVLISCYISNAIKYSKPQGDVNIVDKCDLLLCLPLSNDVWHGLFQMLRNYKNDVLKLVPSF